MKNRTLGIFGKVFLYTMLILILVLGITALFFTNQISTVLKISQQQHLTSVFSPLRQQLEGKSVEEAAEIVKTFHEKNAFFDFAVQTKDGEIIYSTPNFIFPEVISNAEGASYIPEGEPVFTRRAEIFQMSPKFGNDSQITFTTSSGIRVHVAGLRGGVGIYDDFIRRTAFAVAILLAVGGICAFLFARTIAKPIKKLASDTTKMANLEPVHPPAAKGDEIGKTANGVYRMYGHLKNMIQRLETEIKKEREMEENQRYFFTAASHELKTPIAATRALIEGMSENLIEPDEYPETLNECLKMIDEQSKLISEILEIVHLNSSTLALKKEKISLSDIISSVLPAYLTLADAKDQTITADIPKGIYVTVDEALFMRVLSNILMNAIQNTPDGQEIKISCEEASKNTVRLSVLNKGVHLSDEMLSKLFDPFYRTDKARNRTQGRSGLGLTIVKKALTEMEIKYALENTPEGVKFRMDIQ